MMAFIQALSTILFSLVGIVIACLVYELNRQKFRLDLLAKRKEGHDHYKSCIGIFARHGGFIDTTNKTKPKDQAILHAHEFKNYAIFFDEEVELLASELISWVANYSTTEFMVKHGAESNKDHKANIEKLQGLNKQYFDLTKKSDEIVLPFLKIDEPKHLYQILKELVSKIRAIM